MKKGSSYYDEHVGSIVPPSVQEYEDKRGHLPPPSLFALLSLVVLVSVPYIWGGSGLMEQNIVGDLFPAVPKVVLVDPFEDITLGAQSAYVLDVNTGETLFAYNAQEQYPLASLTKIMTTLVVADSVPSDTVVVIDYNDIAQEGDSGLLVGERWRLADIIDFTLTTSSNDGASALAAVGGAVAPDVLLAEIGQEHELRKRDFILRMNAKAFDIELDNTYFLNESGLDISVSTSGAYGSAFDVAHLFAYAIRERADLFDATAIPEFSLSSLNNIEHYAGNTNKSINNIPGFIAGKTGYTDLAGGNLVVAFDVGMMHPIVVAVLGSGKDERFIDVENLVQAVLEKVAQGSN